MKLLLILFVCFVLYSLVANRWYKAESWYKYVGLYLYVGLPGSGKTYALIYHTVRSLASGRRVLTNFRVRPDRIVLALQTCYGLSFQEAKERLKLHSYCYTFADLVSAIDTDVYLDEVQDMLRSVDWDIMPVEVVTWFAQHRHHRCRVKMSTHKLGSVHNYVRALVSNVYIAGPAPFLVRMLRSITGMSKKPLLAYAMVKEANDDLADNPKRKKGKAAIFGALTKNSYMTLDPRIANCYDTHGGVLPSPMEVIRQETGKNAQRYKMNERMFNAMSYGATDGLPALSLEELCEITMNGEQPHVVLQERFTAFEGQRVTEPEVLEPLEPVEPVELPEPQVQPVQKKQEWTVPSSTW